MSVPKIDMNSMLIFQCYRCRFRVSSKYSAYKDYVAIICHGKRSLQNNEIK